ncbi:hypothetical protein [Butyricimonas paravirosa]|uniref:hypothetical protein n=1 Tax=Butyricimonas paravirosa TaxID=1472417 RepID=UPI003520CABB
MSMRIITTKEEREKIIESLTDKSEALVEMNRRECECIKDADVVIEYVLRTNLVKDEDRVEELFKVFRDMNFPDPKNFDHWYYIVQYSMTRELTMDELMRVWDELREYSTDWAVNIVDDLGQDLRLVIIGVM